MRITGRARSAVAGVLLLVMCAGTALAAQTDFEKTMALHEQQAAAGPVDPANWYAVAKDYSDQVRKNLTLRRDVAMRYVLRGLDADTRALTINPAYYDALRLRDTLLRQQATYETDPAVRLKLLADANAVKARADRMQQEQRQFEAATGSGR